MNYLKVHRKEKAWLVCNWDKADKMFYCIRQVWHEKEQRYVNSGFFEVEKTEINGPTMKSIYK
jgi:phage antirepressor YoqD-like protein